MKPSKMIDVITGLTAPVTLWMIVGYCLNKPWVINWILIFGLTSLELWTVKTLIKLSKKLNARCAKPKRSKETTKHSIHHKSEKIKYQIPTYLREGKGFTYNYRKRDL